MNEEGESNECSRMDYSFLEAFHVPSIDGKKKEDEESEDSNPG